MDKYENDVHNCTNQQLAEMLDEIADKAESGLQQMELDDEVLEIMSKASEYQIKVKEEGVYLCKIVPSLDEKGQMSQDHRLITDEEILCAFYWFFQKHCKENRTNIYRIYNGRKLMFEARRPRRKKTQKNKK